MNIEILPINLWVRSEPFNFGTFPLSSPEQFNIKNLKRIISYSKEKSNSENYILSYSVWEHIACDKFHLDKELAWLYFENYYLVHLKKIDERSIWDKQLSEATQKDIDEIRSKVEVCSLRFVLMLFLQNIHKINLCSNVIMQEEWPSHLQQSHNIKQDHSEQKQLMFVRTRLDQILELLANENILNNEISGNVIEALSFLIEGSSDKNRTIKTLYNILSAEENQRETGFIKESRTFNLKKLILWIKTHLGPNPFGICTCFGRECCSFWPKINSTEKETQNNCKTKFIFTNAHFAPKNKRIVIIYQLNKQTWARSSRIMHGCNIKIQHCSQSYIYILSALKSAVVSDCRDVTIILGPVAILLDISNCRNLRIITMTRRIQISNCNKVAVYIRTPCRPLLLGSRNLNIRFGPYNTFYSLLEKQMQKAGINTYLNLWDQCLCIYNEMKTEDLASQLLITPSQFNLFSVPFELEGDTKAIPGGLPVLYQNSVDKKQQLLTDWQKTIAELHLTEEQKESIHKIIQQKFKYWLKINGYQQELDSLERFVKNLMQNQILDTYKALQKK